MGPESMVQSLGMLRQVFEGTSYVEIARHAGVSRTLVEQRVKAIARELPASGGVPGIPPSGPVLVAQLRRERGDFLDAIVRLRPPAQPSVPPKHLVLTDSDIERFVAITRAHSSCRTRDVAMRSCCSPPGRNPRRWRARGGRLPGQGR